METGAVVFCSQCGQSFGPGEVLNLAGAVVCPGCKSVYLRKLQEGALAAGGLRYKGFWIRLVGKMLDGILLDILLIPVTIAALLPLLRRIVAGAGQPPDAHLMSTYLGVMALLELGAMALVVLYNTLMLGRFGTTMGKMAIGARVVAPDGARIGYGRALARSLMEIVSGLMLGIGYLMAAFDERKRALHDRVAGTVVVAK